MSLCVVLHKYYNKHKVFGCILVPNVDMDMDVGDKLKDLNDMDITQSSDEARETLEFLDDFGIYVKCF